MGHWDTLKKVLDLGGKREVKRVERPRLVRPQRVNPTIFILGEEGTLNITTQGAIRKPMVLPNSNSPFVSYNPPYTFKKQFGP